MKSLKKINYELSILIVGRIFQIIIAFVIIKLATKFLVASEMGNFYLIVSIAGFFGLFLVGPIGLYINRKTHQWHKEENLLNVFYLYNYYILFLAFSSMGIIYILNCFAVGNNIEVFYLSFFMALYIICHTWNQTIIPMINMLEGRIAFVVFTLSTQILFLALSYLFINILGAKGLFWFLGQGVAFGIVAFLGIIYFTRKIQNNFSLKKSHNMINMDNVKNLFVFSLPLAVSALFFWLQSQSYSLIIEKNIGSGFLGYFGVGMAVALAISSAFETIVMQYLYPQMYKNMNDEDKFQIIISNIINLIIPIYFLLAIFLSFFASYINVILVDEQYYNSYCFIIFGAWIAFFRMSSNIISNIAHSKMKTRKLILPNIIGALIAVFGVILATQSENYQYYIPIALLISGMVSFIIMYIKMNNLVKINIIAKNFFFVILYSLPFLIVLMFYKYPRNILHSTLIVAIFGLYFLYILCKLINRKSLSEQ